jgi:hypothetical protein
MTVRATLFPTTVDLPRQATMNERAAVGATELVTVELEVSGGAREEPVRPGAALG